MTELLNNGIDHPRLFLDDEGDVYGIEDDPDFPDLDFTEDRDSDELNNSMIDRKDREAVYVRPNTLEDNLNRIRSREMGRPAVRAEEPDTQESLGDGLSTARVEEASSGRPLDEVIWSARGTEVKELREAIERFGMNELALEQYRQLSDTQKKLFILPFKKFQETVTNHLKRIINAEGRVDLDYSLLRDHDKDASPEEVMEYAQFLALLIQALQKTGIPQQVDDDFDDKFHVKSSLRRKAIVRDTNYKKYQLIFKMDKNGQKHAMRDSHRLAPSV